MRTGTELDEQPAGRREDCLDAIGVFVCVVVVVVVVAVVVVPVLVPVVDVPVPPASARVGSDDRRSKSGHGEEN